MMDIIRFNGEKFDLGFSRVYNVKEFRIKESIDDDKLKKIGNVDIIFGSEKNFHEDKLNINSGLNQVVCKILRDREIAVGFSFTDFLFGNERILRNMIQNVRLCRKYKVKMVIASLARNKWEMRDCSELISFGKSIGMTEKEAREGLNFRK